MNVNQITCKHCGDEFDTKGKYDSHYKSKHQKKIKLDNWREDQNHVERSEDGKFTCICGKKFLRGDALIYHQKSVIFGLRKKQMNQNLRMVFFYFQVN